MSRRTPRLLAGLAAVLIVNGLVALASVPAPATASVPPPAPARAPAAAPEPTPGVTVERTRRVVVQWHGDQRRPTYQKTADVPGIGQVDLVCRPDSAMLRLRADDRDAETQMWLAKFEDKSGRSVVAVKNVRVYRYATAADDGRGGTGRQAHEGLNQRTPIEDYANGSGWGAISQRPGRNRPGGGELAVPVTSFRLTWYWERFAHPGSQFCRMTLALRTSTTEQFGLSWHGDQEASGRGRDTSVAAIPGVGQVELRCETGRDGDQTVALRPAYDPAGDPDGTHAPFMDYDYVTGEGAVEDHVEHWSDLDYDPATGLLGPVDLPRNGMMRLWFSVGGVKRAWALSSYMVTNNAAHPELNLCEVAAAPLP